jgi:hypothetical protein
MNLLNSLTAAEQWDFAAMALGWTFAHVAPSDAERRAGESRDGDPQRTGSRSPFKTATTSRCCRARAGQFG